MSENAFKVILADDHVLYRDCIKGLFDRWDDFQVVGEASNGKEALDLCRALKPNLVLMDVSMPGMGGIEATRILASELPLTAVVMLTASLSEDTLIEAMLNGARGYLLKNIHGYQLHARLREALAGDLVLSSDAVLMCLDLVRAGRQAPQSERVASDALAKLTEQERQILCFVAQGKSNREIGDILYIGQSTVKKRFSMVLTKLGLENRVQAAVYALNAGLID